jgi:hypothetical protein
MTTSAVPDARLAKSIALLMLLSIVFGGLGESYLPGRIIVSNDPAATALNIAQHPLLFRLGFATYLVEALCDIALAVLFYVLLKPVSRTWALFSVFLGAFSTATYAVAEMFYFGSQLALTNAEYLKAFTPQQLDALALLAMKMSSRIGYSFLGAYGLTTAVRGYLLYRSGYVPRILGALFVIGGAAFIYQSAATILAPQYTSFLVLMPMGVAGIAFMLWLFVKGFAAPRPTSAA